MGLNLNHEVKGWLYWYEFEHMCLETCLDFKYFTTLDTSSISSTIPSNSNWHLGPDNSKSLLMFCVMGLLQIIS